MENVKTDEVAVNLTLMKRSRFYHIFNPNSAKILKRNIYWIFSIVFIAVYISLFLFGHMGLFINMEDTLSDIEFLMLLFTYFIQYIYCIQIIVILYRANTVWDVFGVARLDFLTSKLCRKHIDIMYDCRDWVIKATNLFSLILTILYIEWMLFPLVTNAFNDDTAVHRKQNILNFRFPVSIHTYNHYYIMFYVMEVIASIIIVYVGITVNTFIVTFCWVIIYQYRVLTKSFANVGYENKSQSEHYEDFKSCLIDQIQLYSKLKSFYFIIRPIMLLFVAMYSCAIIFITYSFIVICTSLRSYSIFDAIKLGSTVLFICLQLLLYCHLFDSINTNRDSVNFGIYSCNWTMMDLKFKKLLLLAMRMNDANQIILKASPKKIINLQLFANLMTTLYNIISVMLKTINNNNQQ